MELGTDQARDVGTVYRWRLRLPFGFAEAVTAPGGGSPLRVPALDGWHLEAANVPTPVAGGRRDCFTLANRLPGPWDALGQDRLVARGIDRALANTRKRAEARPAPGPSPG